METDIELVNNEHKLNFDSNTLYTILIDTKFSTIREELLLLYDYQNKIVHNIHENINN
jgi:hypothetical protein